MRRKVCGNGRRGWEKKNRKRKLAEKRVRGILKSGGGGGGGDVRWCAIVNLYVVFPRLLLDDAVDLVESLDGQFLEDGRRSRLRPSLDRRTAVVDADLLLVRRVARLDGDVRNVLGRKLLVHGRRQRYGLRPDLSRRKAQRTTR